MSPRLQHCRLSAAVLVSSTLAICSPAMLGLAAAHAVDRDRDDDGMPNRWERVHGLNPDRASAIGDKDHDRLLNLGEFRKGADPEDQDSDNDGHDDGDEVKDGFRSTDVDDRDSDDDGLVDGDEDADHDSTDNEDEDDAREQCQYDDDDRDADHIDDEDENELRLRVGDSDSDDDGLEDGDEDDNEDGTSNEDEDDDEVDGSDVCDEDRDDDGESDEDESDVMGTIMSFDMLTGELRIVASGGTSLMFIVTEDTEVEFEDSDTDASAADLIAGTEVAEVEIDDDGTVEEIEIYEGVLS